MNRSTTKLVVSKTNPRADISQKKYRMQLELGLDKVKQLLAEGHSQSEISRLLKISQPTVSRDVNQIKNGFKIDSRISLDNEMKKHMDATLSMDAII